MAGIAGMWSTLGTAFSGFNINQWRRQYANPLEVQGGKTITRPQWFQLLWGYYTNSAFEYIPQFGNQWQAYKSAYRLYRNMRSLYNPTSRLVDFYAGQVYPGVLTVDGQELPSGIPLAIPFTEDTPQELIAPIASLWRWSNWQSSMRTMIRYAAATGNCLVEVEDDVDSGKVVLNVVWPGLVRNMDLDHAGNVKEYRIEYAAIDDNGFTYTYTREVNQQEIATYKNGSPYDYDGFGAVRDNPYGFVPAVWVKHRDLGGEYGAPVIHGSIGKIDELNSLASHIHDHIHKIVDSPAVLWSSGNIGKIGQTQKRPPSNEFSDPESDRDSVMIWQGPEGGKVDSLIKDMDISAATEGMSLLVAEIEQDHPELVMYRQLREMSQVTGPAAQRLLGDVAQLVQEASSGYDRASIALFGMGVAIGGWRANNGDWGPSLNKWQQPFTAFDLDSYDKGDLDMDIAPRPLVTPTELEQIQLEQAREALKSAQVQTSIMMREDIKE